MPAPVQTVHINPDGTFEPASVTVDAGTIIEWTLESKFDAIVRAKATAAGYVATSYDPTVIGELTGPMPHNAGGIFTLSPNPKAPGLGLYSSSVRCGQYTVLQANDGTWLCRVRPDCTVEIGRRLQHEQDANCRNAHWAGRWCAAGRCVQRRQPRRCRCRDVRLSCF